MVSPIMAKTTVCSPGESATRNACMLISMAPGLVLSPVAVAKPLRANSARRRAVPLGASFLVR